MEKKICVLVVGQPNGWFIRRAKEEGEKYGIEVHGCRANALVAIQDATGTSLSVDGKDFFDFDLIHLFTVQENRLLWYAAGGEAVKHGIQIVDENCVNTFISEQSILHKLAKQSELSLPFPKTTIISSFTQAIAFLRNAPRPIVVKTLNSRRGRGVVLVKHWHNFFWFYLKRKKNEFYAFREFIDGDGDYRINVIGGKAYTAIIRRAQEGEWRNNISLGGTGTNVLLSEIPDLVKIAEKTAIAFGYDSAGVDIMVAKDGTPYILEINRSPELDSFEELSGVNLVGKMMELYLRKCKK